LPRLHLVSSLCSFVPATLPSFPPRRSSDLAGYRGGGASPGDAGEDAEEGRTRFSGGRLVTVDGGMLLAGRLHVLGRLGTAVAVADRKSTRLNSSHVSISYAVFCLKTKKTSS